MPIVVDPSITAQEVGVSSEALLQAERDKQLKAARDASLYAIARAEVADEVEALIALRGGYPESVPRSYRTPEELDAAVVREEARREALRASTADEIFRNIETRRKAAARG